MMKHFINFDDFSNEEINTIINKAIELKAEHKIGKINNLMSNKTLGMIFDKSSTRTRVSFEAGMTQLGGHALFLSEKDIQLGRGEPLEDSGTDTVSVGGFLGATEATHDIAIEEWLSSPLITAFAILIITSLIFGSPLIAGILVATLLVTLFAQYGLGGYYTSVENWSGNLHFATLVSLSIAMGLGVDYGIYMISRLKE